MKRIAYRRLWEKAHNSSLLSWIDIHHINGNRFDNRIENLKPVTLSEHYEIHYSQGDYGACQAILMRMPHDKKLIADAASKCQLDLLRDGNHNFQKMSKKRRSDISKKVGLNTLKSSVGIHALNKNTELHRETASLGGKIARDTKKGIHNPEKRGGNFVRATYWWTNINTLERCRSKQQPSPEWRRGMK